MLTTTATRGNPVTAPQLPAVMREAPLSRRCIQKQRRGRTFTRIHRQGEAQAKRTGKRGSANGQVAQPSPATRQHTYIVAGGRRSRKKSQTGGISDRTCKIANLGAKACLGDASGEACAVRCASRYAAQAPLACRQPKKAKCTNGVCGGHVDGCSVDKQDIMINYVGGTCCYVNWVRKG